MDKMRKLQCGNSSIFKIVNERRKWYNKKTEFSGGKENGSILTIKKYLST